ncbi:MAG: lipoprotein-releasing ABC transporter permease subunit [Candidatus Obscuribacterales bacterium]|nr:lipoprotein-releasing ABC transporter permease subunit [Steroidobacteraceae bacterium]
MRYELFIGARYLRSARGSDNRFVSFISVISMLGIAIGVAVLIVVLSVMNGFERELRERILSQTAHATISAFGASLPNWQQIEARAEANPQVVAAAPYIEGQAMLIGDGKERGKTSGAIMYGVAPEREQRVSQLAEHLRSGSMDKLSAGSFGVILGEELARALGVALGDRVVMVVPQATVTIAGVTPRLKRLTVVGTFSAGMYEYDRNFAYVHIEDAARIYRMQNEVTGVRLKVVDLFQAPRVSRELMEALGGGHYVTDWTHRHANFFRSIALTKRVLFVILLLVIGVAAFNIVSTLVMVVKDKQSDIAILRTLGVTPRSVLMIFVTQGSAIGLLGTAAGIALGALLSNNLEVLVHGLENVLNTKFLDAKVYFMSDLPATVEWGDVVKIATTAFGLCCLSTLYPAYRAARTQPAAALRHE